MTDLLLQIGASKLAVSAALACVAWVVQRRAGPSPLSWALWLLLLAGLLTPPLVPVPVFSPGVEPPASIVFGMSPQAPATPTLAVSAAEWLSLRWKEGLAFLWLSGVAVVAAGNPQRERHVLADRVAGQQLVVLEYHPDPAPQPRNLRTRQAGGVHAVYVN